MATNFFYRIDSWQEVHPLPQAFKAEYLYKRKVKKRTDSRRRIGSCLFTKIRYCDHWMIVRLLHTLQKWLVIAHNIATLKQGTVSWKSLSRTRMPLNMILLPWRATRGLIIVRYWQVEASCAELIKKIESFAYNPKSRSWVRIFSNPKYFINFFIWYSKLSLNSH